MKGMLTGVVLGLTALAIGATVGGAAPKPGFRPGTWVGSGVQKGIFSVVPGDPSPVDGTATFTVKVTKSNRVGGSLTLKTRMGIDHAGMRGTIVGVANTTLSGSGRDIRFAGEMRLSGQLTDGRITLPFALTKPVSGRLLITRSLCTSVVGGTDSQLSFTWRAVPKPGTTRPKC